MVSPWRLRPRCSGGAGVIQTASGLRLLRPPGPANRYRNAQIDDFGQWPGNPRALQPPFTLRLRARTSHPADRLVGTAGFGLWSYPWAWPLRMPQAVWFFFGAPPHDMPLAIGIPGHGWKAAVVDTGRPAARKWIPLAPVIVPLLNIPPLYRRIWPCIQRDVGVAEAVISQDIAQWHEYEIRWGLHESELLVDGITVLRAPSPRGPLSIVIWIDNQYAIVRPTGQLGWGVRACNEAQWIEVALISPFQFPTP
ncbi:MAG TPA: hypothetical protein DEF43_19265 [Chloroflexus aurantiacus]|uniref:GH16 domain-containing protein n=1 Tax=Chloroflexus aurantiacus (strain ATCC 29366 / DSM 635 / J-10-fl) TaxID=324602 RepID=A9WJI3_CHLAA|nr:hypothetical protein [Chloroflexus aurantiacus]ABY35887.1 conserved hypothetical protein [Chloroflexus aurantiacus J-10-fl]HBW69245.1 hypothetical protein [Chloroflexus aurantiacus]